MEENEMKKYEKYIEEYEMKKKEERDLKLERLDTKLFEVLNGSRLNIQDMYWALMKHAARIQKYELESEEDTEDFISDVKRTCLKCGSHGSLGFVLIPMAPTDIESKSYWKCTKCGWEYHGELGKNE